MGEEQKISGYCQNGFLIKESEIEDFMNERCKFKDIPVRPRENLKVLGTDNKQKIWKFEFSNDILSSIRTMENYSDQKTENKVTENDTEVITKAKQVSSIIEILFHKDYFNRVGRHKVLYEFIQTLQYIRIDIEKLQFELNMAINDIPKRSLIRIYSGSLRGVQNFRVLPDNLRRLIKSRILRIPARMVNNDDDDSTQNNAEKTRRDKNAIWGEQVAIMEDLGEIMIEVYKWVRLFNENKTLSKSLPSDNIEEMASNMEENLEETWVNKFRFDKELRFFMKSKERLLFLHDKIREFTWRPNENMTMKTIQWIIEIRRLCFKMTEFMFYILRLSNNTESGSSKSISLPPPQLRGFDDSDGPLNGHNESTDWRQITDGFKTDNQRFEYYMYFMVRNYACQLTKDKRTEFHRQFTLMYGAPNQNSSFYKESSDIITKFHAKMTKYFEDIDDEKQFKEMTGRNKPPIPKGYKLLYVSEDKNIFMNYRENGLDCIPFDDIFQNLQYFRPAEVVDEWLEL